MNIVVIGEVLSFLFWKADIYKLDSDVTICIWIPIDKA